MSHTPAFDRAAALAGATGATLHIVAFDAIQALAVAGLLDHQAMAQAREGYLLAHRHWLEQEARYAQKKGRQVTAEVVWVHRYNEEILDYINDFQADLVIKDLDRVPGLKRVVYTPLDWLLLRDAGAPLHWVTDGRNPMPLKILAAVDLSHLEELTQGLNERIVDLAAQLALCCEAQLHLLNVSGWTVAGESGVNLKTLTIEESLRDAVNDAQEEAFATLAERGEVAQEHSHLLSGIPHRTVERFAADNGFDLMVMGTLHHRGSHLLLGSTAELILNAAPCALLLVRPDD